MLISTQSSRSTQFHFSSCYSPMCMYITSRLHLIIIVSTIIFQTSVSRGATLCLYQETYHQILWMTWERKESFTDLETTQTDRTIRILSLSTNVYHKIMRAFARFTLCACSEPQAINLNLFWPQGFLPQSVVTIGGVVMDSPALPMDIKDINVCLLSAKKTKSVSSPSLRDLDQMSLW